MCKFSPFNSSSDEVKSIKSKPRSDWTEHEHETKAQNLIIWKGVKI